LPCSKCVKVFFLNAHQDAIYAINTVLTDITLTCTNTYCFSPTIPMNPKPFLLLNHVTTPCIFCIVGVRLEWWEKGLSFWYMERGAVFGRIRKGAERLIQGCLAALTYVGVYVQREIPVH
jgi:hypothetical protein